jgi:hypothetical protein
LIQVIPESPKNNINKNSNSNEQPASGIDQHPISMAGCEEKAEKEIEKNQDLC